MGKDLTVKVSGGIGKTTLLRVIERSAKLAGYQVTSMNLEKNTLELKINTE